MQTQKTGRVFGTFEKTNENENIVTEDDLLVELKEVTFYKNIERKTLEAMEIVGKLRNEIGETKAENSVLRETNKINDINCWEWVQKRYEMLVSIEDYEMLVSIEDYEMLVSIEDYEMLVSIEDCEMLVSIPKIEDYEKNMTKMKRYEEDIKE